ncbi:MAG: hypothetical protein M1839_003569 [Geoglossum umbratile]|nr:MAG: hypothetical protein M1839_003569 [Geoglossum umbratile]
MYSFFDRRFDPTTIDETGCLPDFDPGLIINIGIDVGDTTTKVPLFMKFFRRCNTPRICETCSESKYEIDYTDRVEWERNCEHEFNTCRVCTAIHIASTLENVGCEQIKCPQCERHLTRIEIKWLADDETFEKCDRQKLLRYLSQNPDFLWCVKCRNYGQIHLDRKESSRVSCNECNTLMCFNHQSLWHSGLDCLQFDNKRIYGDPNAAATKDFLKKNTRVRTRHAVMSSAGSAWQTGP